MDEGAELREFLRLCALSMSGPHRIGRQTDPRVLFRFCSVDFRLARTELGQLFHLRE